MLFPVLCFVYPMSLFHFQMKICVRATCVNRTVQKSMMAGHSIVAVRMAISLTKTNGHVEVCCCHHCHHSHWCLSGDGGSAASFLLLLFLTPLLLLLFFFCPSIRSSLSHHSDHYDALCSICAFALHWPFGHPFLKTVCRIFHVLLLLEDNRLQVIIDIVRI